ncbi:MAG: tRNA 2-selenouridine(34) synthase MnmH [Nanoarchaeota archaeon]|nr:tRNA 2-selenouridine(34) synthase MnmH [Nanoarchaeota archaeon]MCG2718787.1 tRNA 2-selenouridine(34) synthase MnmH [Nanoarchaeota archaeon]
MKTISIEKALKGKYIFIDVRTPKEFEECTIPESINVPLFSNEERAVIGTIYKQVSKDDAIKKGLDIVSKKISKLVGGISKYKDKKLVVFCWRGGMRSKSFTGLLEGMGYDTKQLEGGHKAYRKHILERFENYKLKPKIILLSGLTGTGKTDILNEFLNSLDLEGLAQHRGSVLGPVGLKPRSQKMFDALIFKRLEELKDEKYIVVEGEARKIGKVQIPEFFFKAMKKGIQVKIICDFNDRVKRLVDEYSGHKKELLEKIPYLKKTVGNDKKLKLWINMLKEDKFEELAEILLKEYYDPLYSHTVDNIEYDYVIELDYVKKLEEIMG